MSFETWGIGRRGWRMETADQYARRVEAAKRVVSDLTQASTEDLYRYLDTLSPKADARNHARGALIAWYDWQIEQGLRTDNPADKIPARKRLKKLPKALTRGQASKVWGAAAWHDDLRVRALVALMLFGALRVGEALALRWEDVGDDQLHVTGKGGHERTVAAHSVVWRSLDALPLQGRYVLSGADEPISYDQAYRWVKQVGEAAGVRLTPHVLRHTAATELVRAGVDIRTVQDVLGHSEMSTTAAYLRVSDERTRAAINALEF